MKLFLKTNFPKIFKQFQIIKHSLVITKIYSKKINSFFNDKNKIIKFYKKPQIDNLILSCTSFPARIKYFEYTLFSVINQNIRPKKIILWLSVDEFPNKEKDIPENLKRYEPYGLEIKFKNNNIRSYKKLIYSLSEFHSEIIITFDDDVFYNKNWLKLLYFNHLKNPNYIIANRVHKVSFTNYKIDSYNNWKKNNLKLSFLNFFTGIGGILYPPDSLYKDVCNEKLFLDLSPNADDIWFYVMALLNKTKILKINYFIKLYRNFDYIYNSDYLKIPKLSTNNVKNNENDIQLKKVLCHYNIYDNFYNLYGENE